MSKKMKIGVCLDCISEGNLSLPSRHCIYVDGLCKHCLRERKVYVAGPSDGGMVMAVVMVMCAVVSFFLVLCAVSLLTTGCKTIDKAEAEWGRVKDRIEDVTRPDAPEEPTSPEKPTPSDEPDKPMEPLPEPPVESTHIKNVIGVWFGPNLSNATVDERFELKVENDGRTWSSAPSDWRAGRAGPGCPSDCTTMICAAYRKPDGTWVGGKFDWNRTPSSPRDWKNVANGYNDWQAPPVGTEMTCWAYTEDGRRVSKEARTTYRP